MDDALKVEFSEERRPQTCPLCGSESGADLLTWVFAWNCSTCGPEWACIPCSKEHHYRHFPERRPPSHFAASAEAES